MTARNRASSVRDMENAITPEQVREAALKARVTLRDFLRSAKVAPSTFYGWERTGERPKKQLTMLRLMDAVEGVNNG